MNGVQRAGSGRSNGKGPHAFTLLELLIVMGILALLLVVVVPAITSLSKSSSRKGAISNLLGALEQARVLAIKDGQPTYVVFPTQVGTDAAMLERYSYRSYSIFQDDAANPGTTKQITPWRSLPTGVSIRSGSLAKLAPPTTNFAFTPAGQGATGQFPFLKFTSSGEVDPSSTQSATGPVKIDVFEGAVDSSGTDKDTSATKFSETINVARLTGRAQYTP